MISMCETAFILLRKRLSDCGWILKPWSQLQFAFSEICAQAYIFHDSALEGLVISRDEIASVFSADAEGQYIRSRVLQEIRNHRKVLQDTILHAQRSRHQNAVYRSAEINIENILATHESLFANVPRKEPGALRTQIPLHIAYFHNLTDPKQIKDRLLTLCEKTRDPRIPCSTSRQSSSALSLPFYAHLSLPRWLRQGRPPVHE